jgi:hypothetical protein
MRASYGCLRGALVAVVVDGVILAAIDEQVQRRGHAQGHQVSPCVVIRTGTLAYRSHDPSPTQLSCDQGVPVVPTPSSTVYLREGVRGYLLGDWVRHLGTDQMFLVDGSSPRLSTGVP